MIAFKNNIITKTMIKIIFGNKNKYQLQFKKKLQNKINKRKNKNNIMYKRLNFSNSG